MNCVALIPARSGSKRILNKNIRPLAGIPLIAWTVRRAVNSGIFSTVQVSTDSNEILNIAVSYGASQSELRPVHLAGDNSNLVDVLRYHAQSLEPDDLLNTVFVVLQPTSPFRSFESLSTAIKNFTAFNSSVMVSFTTIDFFPEWCFRIKDGYIAPLMGWEGSKKRSQDIEQTIQPNGNFFIAKASFLLSAEGLYSSQTTPFVEDAKSIFLDIDTEDDFAKAEAIAELFEVTDSML